MTADYVRRWERFSVIFGLTLLSSTLIILFGLSPSVGAVNLTNQSPTNGNYIYQDNTSRDDMAKHLLIASEHGDVEEVRLGMYSTSGSPKTISIYNAGEGDGGLCRAYGTAARPLTSDFIEVRISEAGNQSNNEVYRIKGKDVCNSSMAHNTPDSTSPKFYGTYRGPRLTEEDPDTGLYYLKIAIRYVSPDTLVRNIGSGQISTFKVVGPTDSLIGNIDTGGGGLNNSTLAKEVGRAGPVTHKFAFALPCRITDKQNKDVSVYDSDNGLQAGPPVKFYIAWIDKDNNNKPVALTPSEYVDYNRYPRYNPDNPNALGYRGAFADDIGSIAAFRPRNGTTATATAKIKNMDPDKKYVLIIKNVWGTGTSGGASNFIYVGLPGDSIYGAENFQCPGWELSPKTVNNATQVKSGQQAKWRHDVINLGADTTDKAVSWKVRQFFRSGGTDSPKTTAAQGTIASGGSVGTILTRRTAYTAKDVDVGKKVCQEIGVKPWKRKGNGDGGLLNRWEYSEPKCIPIGNVGDFTPYADVAPDAAEPQSEYNWSAGVSDGRIDVTTWPGPPAEKQFKSSRITWQVHKIVYPATVTSTYSGGDSAFACPAGATCTQESSPPGHARKEPNGNVNISRTGVLGDLAAGSRVCYVSSVYLPPETRPKSRRELWYRVPVYETGDENGNGIEGELLRYRKVYHWVEYQKYDYSTRKWRHSDAACIVVAKRPRVQIRGNDLVAQGAVTSGTSSYADGKTYGSFGEYAVLSGGLNGFVGSGAPYTNGSNGSMPSWSRLTFANTDAGSNQYGKFGLIPSAPRIAEYYQARLGSAQNWGGGALTGKSGLYVANGDVTLPNSNNIHSTVILYVKGKLTIDGSITYQNGTYDTDSRLPQVILIADTINIKNSTTQIDSWLVTAARGEDDDGQTGAGSINTCSDVSLTAKLTNAVCDNPLTVNGPVITTSLHLRRTAGARNEDAKGEPAEIFNLRPDAYVWAYREVQADNRAAQTVDILELPPRF
ncbi:hypothetical protein RAAC3_TM7C00001G0447 [Candidatus Saccharibacteria bacterium RAAC3_TM7_1]|nr:hypothetical protein RAAC3_TM7C00001G0447 [Candidatus Saccharibacteria bacterium RAAC3_TM7_1]HCZ28169.1 hypothetical protein [Candidatus Saccharibacteria bacterium]